MENRSGKNVHVFETQWKSVSSRWGHKLHSVCSYMAMFPPSLPHYFIERCTRPGDMVIDPFCGRGTTPLEACLMGRIGVGNDLNYLAYVLTKAKVALPPSDCLYDRLLELERNYVTPPEAIGLLDTYRRLSNDVVKSQSKSTPEKEPELTIGEWEELRTILVQLRKIYSGFDQMPFYDNEDYRCTSTRSADIEYTPDDHDEIWLFYHPSTLHQLVYLKNELADDPCDQFIKAVVLGIMHGRGRFYLSIPMPNTFSMTARYVLAYTYKHRLVLPDRDVFQCIRAKMSVMGFPNEIEATLEEYTPGEAVFGDVKDLSEAIEPIIEKHEKRPKLLVTSPPYLGVIKYGQYNWLRLWFLENDIRSTPGLKEVLYSFEDDGLGTINSDLSKATDAILDDSHRDLDDYIEFIRTSMKVTYEIMDDDSLSVWVIGDVEQDGKERICLAYEVWEKAAKPEGWKLLDIITDRVEANRKVSKIWGETRGKATKTDRVLLLYKETWPMYATTVKW